MAIDELNQREVSSLVQDLIAATTSGQVDWEQMDEHGELFVMRSSGGLVSIGSMNGRDHPFFLRIFDADERKIYELLTEVAPFYGGLEAQVAELFVAARDSVYDVRGTIESIRDSLGI
jgi:hypothetical protein